MFLLSSFLPRDMSIKLSLTNAAGRVFRRAVLSPHLIMRQYILRSVPQRGVTSHVTARTFDSKLIRRMNVIYIIISLSIYFIFSKCCSGILCLYTYEPEGYMMMCLWWIANFALLMLVQVNNTYVDPDDKCLQYTCDKISGQPVTKEIKTSCPAFNPLDCEPVSLSNSTDITRSTNHA